MSKKVIILIILCFSIFGCKTYDSFDSKKEKKACISTIEKEIFLPVNYRKKLFLEDSITNEICTSLKQNINKSLIKRRIDSFCLGNYTKIEMYFILKADRIVKNHVLEIDRRKGKQHLAFKNFNEVKKFLDNFKIIDSVKIKK
jgi:hypothetical protein